jgi:Flp pilus assembly protein TadG
MDAQDRRTDGFLTRLKRDTRGNTLAIVGAALVPLAAMIGSGLDMSRAYMAKTRLQSACDAASLAARRVMTDDQMTDAVRAEAIRFFNFNFPQGLYGTEEFAPTVTRPQAGSVAITASSRIPTTIMSMFGFTSLPLNVSCEASLNFVNTDVMLVLDVTGSMLCAPEESSSCGRSAEFSGSRIVALREAVMALYDELRPIQDQLEDSGMRLRYGVVPFSSSVNVGGLIYGANPNYIVDSATYQSRTPLYVQSQSVETFNNQTQTQCNNRAVNFTGNNLSIPFTEKLTSRSGSGVCTVTTRVLDRQVTSTFSDRWLHEPRTLATDAFKNPSNNVQLPTRTPGTSQTSSWNGCIEERDTVSTITASSGYNIPSGAHDLNIDAIPISAATRWRPMWPEVTYRRTAGTTNSASGTQMSSLAAAWYACPTAARRLQAWTRPAMQSYANSLVAVGGTYHDIGMVWGARMISPGGIFADSPDMFNGMPVNRHIIFMTDGVLSPNCNSYTSYGIEQHQMRVTGSSTCPQQRDRHLQRFTMLCNAVKSMNVSIWVLGFTEEEPTMVQCASNANQYFAVANRAQLIERFRQIGNQIGALRLTQ